MKRLLCVMILSACGGAEHLAWDGSVDTLPSGTVRATNPAQGMWEDGKAWQLVPSLVLGEVDGPDATVFAAISALEVDRDGRIYVLDRQANELRIFTREGEHVRSVGRAGGGPGEYRNANGLAWLTPDTLLVVDQRGGRYSILTRDGDFVRSVPRRLGFYSWVFTGGYHGGRVYEQSAIGRGDDRQPALLGTLVAVSGSVPQDLVPAEEIGPAPAAAVDTVLLPEAEGPVTDPLSVRTDRGGMMMGVPWAPGPVYHFDANGDLWFGHGSEFRIYRMAAADTTMEIVLESTPVPVTDDEVAAWEQSEGVRRFREMGGRIDVSTLPRVKPHFSALYLDPDGFLWVTVPARQDGTAFAVFDPEGRYLGRLRVAGVGRDAYLAPVVRNGRLHFVGRDELDVQRVYRFDIVK